MWVGKEKYLAIAEYYSYGISTFLLSGLQIYINAPMFLFLKKTVMRTLPKQRKEKVTGESQLPCLFEVLVTVSPALSDVVLFLTYHAPE